jgi:carboxyl-terminal processing protease
VERLLGELREQGVQGIVVDLRNNGGGSLLEATTLTGLFIDKGPVVQVRNSSGRISLEEDDDAGMAWDGPLAVLVNRYSASASEIFAAAIQDYGRGVVIGEPTFGKGTVQSLLDLDDYGPADKPGMGQLKITMAQFFRVNGGSTQNKGVVPDIRFPSAGDPQEYGERSFENALPWTSIDPARFDPSGDLSRLVAVADNLHQKRVVDDQEFGWLLSDIDEYNEHVSETKVSLLESVGRQRLKEEEEERDKRKALRSSGDPLLAPDDVLADAVDPDMGEYPDMQDEGEGEAEDEEEKGPDLLLREAAHIVADMAGLQSDLNLLNQQFAQLSAQAAEDPKLN